MDGQVIGAFLATAMIILLTPGPVMAIVIGNAAHGGWIVGFRTVLGIAFGEVVLVGLLILSFLLSSRVFDGFFRWFSLASAVYLAWLAIDTVWCAARRPAGRSLDRSSRPFRDGLTVTISNPTALLFYSAFFTPFIQASQSPTVQFGVLATVYLALSFVFDLVCVIVVARLVGQRIHNPTFARIAGLCSSAVYLGIAGSVVASFFQEMVR